jgi:hypothetical protein
MADGRPDRRFYETAVLATLRDRLRSGDVWVEPSSPPSRLTDPRRCHDRRAASHDSACKPNVL